MAENAEKSTTKGTINSVILITSKDNEYTDGKGKKETTTIAKDLKKEDQ